MLATGLLVANESLSPRISWDTKIADILPGWELMDPIATKETTISDAMSHRTGLPRHDLMYGKFDNVLSTVSRPRYVSLMKLKRRPLARQTEVSTTIHRI